MIRLQYSRLCRLIHDSLHQFTGKSTVTITKEQEKSLLITLSQVLNKIKLWILEFDSDSNSSSSSDSDSGIDDRGNRSIHGSPCHSSDSKCILKIINDLVFLLAIESRYAQHLAGNVLVAVAEFVLVSDTNWAEFVQSLCSYFELAIVTIVSPISTTSSSSNTASWYSVGGIVLVLHNILKQQNHELDVKSMQIYLNALGSCLRNTPWDSFDGGFIVNGNLSQPVSWFEFCGYLVRLFCSVVSRSSSPESMADSPDKTPAIREILKIFPKVLEWCFGEKRDCGNNACFSRYIQHKILVLMIKLASLLNLDYETVISWLHLIDKYFRDFLFESVTQSEANPDDCLKDSPFLSSISNLKNNKSSNRHLQRRVVFIYLNCAFRLIGSKKTRPESCSKKGFEAVYEWLQKHLPADILENANSYSDRCKIFAKSFIELYMHEDDMLFEILLQLTHTPFDDEQKVIEERESEKNVRFLLSEIFDPIHLFHLFLFELHYDHQVLLDYLISKDTGAKCAEYLLRCLRVICEKWHSFFGFSFAGEFENELSCKRRKVTNNSCMSEARKRPFHDANDCLLLLKKSIENLAQKGLFPYNPKVLLRRLTRFHEHCLMV